MRAIIVEAKQLAIREVQTPKPKSFEILVRVHAASINRADLMQKEGKYAPPHGASEILGLDIAGVVEEVGPHVTRWRVGDRVMSLLEGGAYAQYAVTHEEIAMPIPERLSFEEAAAIPEVFLTAYQSLFTIGELQPEQWVLIQSGAGGVGTAAIQCAREFGAKAIATAGSTDKIEACLDLGAQAAINYQAGPFVEKILEITENHGVDLIIDFFGASMWEQNWNALARGGAIVMLATLGGSVVEKVDLRKLFDKWGTLSTSRLRNRSQEFKIHLVKEFSAFALERFEKGTLKPIIHQVLPWKEIQKAHLLLENRENIGKIVISIN